MENANNLIISLADFNSTFIKIFDLIFKEYPEGVVYKDWNFSYKIANSAFCECYKIKNRSDFIGSKDANFLSKENRKIVESVNENIVKEKRPVNYVMSLEEDQQVLLNITSIPIFFENNFLGIISIVKDITQEENLKEDFVEKHFQIKSLLENIPMIIYMQDKNLNYIAGTKHSKNFVKLGHDAFSNTYLNIANIEKEEYFENLQVLNDKNVLIKEKEIIDRNDRKHWYKIYKVPIKDLNSEVSGIITLANNIDIEKQLQAQRETFVATLGHDLKNPTIAQIRSLELLLKGAFGELSLEQKELLEMVLDSCRYMNGMLATLLATYRNFNGTVKLNFNEFSLADLVNECISEMIYIAKDKNINVKIIDNLKDSLIFADRVQIKRVIMNLLSNGIKYAYSNTTLNIYTYFNDKNFYFKFENNSPYITEEKQKSLFAQYVSYASAHNELGIGLGLYASKKIIEAHDGNIFIQSTLDNKNTFGFEIPKDIQNKDENRFVYF